MRETLEEYTERIKSRKLVDFVETGTTLESCLTLMKLCKEVKDTITFKELELILYIRNGNYGDFRKFYNAAKANYEAHFLLLELISKDGATN
ncbi:MAG: hypothetical protein K2I23_05420 [Clostridia bacterium]|nr:hypothetical protein [Clostridia bacterium]